MNSKEEIINKIEELQKGLALLGRDRKTVLSHHKAFELTDELESKAEEIKSLLEKNKKED